MGTIYRGSDAAQPPIRPHLNQPTDLCCGSHIPHEPHGPCLGMTFDAYLATRIVADLLDGNVPDGAVVLVQVDAANIVSPADIECAPECGCHS